MLTKDAKYGNSNKISTKEYLKALKMFVYSTVSETHRNINIHALLKVFKYLFLILLFNNKFELDVSVQQ